MTNKKMTLVGILFVSVLVLQFVGQVFTPTAHAASTPFDSLKIEDRASAWALTYGFITCIQTRSDIKQDISGQDALNGDYIQRGNSVTGGGSTTEPINVGLNVEGTDGILGCQNENGWTGTMIDYLVNGNPTKYPDRIAFTLEFYDQKPDGSFTLKSQFRKNEAAFVNYLKAVYGKALFGGAAYPQQAPEGIAYYNLRYGLNTGCDGSLFPGEPDAAAKANYGYRLFKIWDVDPSTGSINYSYYTINKELKTGVNVSDGLNIGLVQEKGSTSCDELKSILGTDRGKKLAEQYSAYVKSKVANKEDPGGKVLTGTPVAGQPSCYTSDIGPLGWIICPIVDGVDGLANAAESFIEDVLTIKPSTYGEGSFNERSSTANPLKTAWASFRIIATLLLVGVALFMILAQMFSLDLVSAYTVKKIVPRLVIAAILIQLSWVLFTGLIIITNTVGTALAELLYAPFGGKETVGNITTILGEFFNNNKGAGATVGVASYTAVIGGGIIAFAAGGTAIAAGILPALGLYALGLALIVGLAIFIGFSVLILRMVALIALLVISPLALVAWILPNTQTVWQKWWSMFSRLLLMYPLIVLLLASGKIFAWIVANSNLSTTAGLIGFFIVIVAYFGPFFLIPTTYSFAGGLFAKIVGGLESFGKTVGNKGNGLLDKRKDRSRWKQTRNSANEDKMREARKKWNAGLGSGRIRPGLGQRIVLGKGGSRILSEAEESVLKDTKDEATRNVQYLTSGLSGDAKFDRLYEIGSGQTIVGKNGQSYKPDKYMKSQAIAALAAAEQGAYIIQAQRAEQRGGLANSDWGYIQDENFGTLSSFLPVVLQNENGERIKFGGGVAGDKIAALDTGAFKPDTGYEKDSEGKRIEEPAWYVEDIQRSLRSGQSSELQKIADQANSKSRFADQSNLKGDQTAGMKAADERIKKVLESNGTMQLVVENGDLVVKDINGNPVS